MVAHPRVGLPYGSVPRLLMSWLTTEALRTKTPVLEHKWSRFYDPEWVFCPGGLEPLHPKSVTSFP
jgi:hypothetical protein